MTCEFCSKTAHHQYAWGQHPQALRCNTHRDIKPDWWKRQVCQEERKATAWARIRLKRDDNDIYGRTPATTAELRIQG